VKRAIWIALLGVLAFAGIVIAQLPATWVAPAAVQRVCASLDGSVWSGTCTTLTAGGRSWGDLSWDLHPVKLFGGKLALHATLAHGVATGDADLELGFNDVLTARNVVADLPIDAAILPGVPRGLAGGAHLNLTRVVVQHDVIKELVGRIEAHNLEDHSGHDTPLGSYVLTFPDGTSGEPTGALRDTDGPLAVEGTLRLTSNRGFDLQGFVAPRAGATPEVVNNLRYLGPPDATGRREFSLAGTF
jgi:general secretion pathway protein N